MPLKDMFNNELSSSKNNDSVLTVQNGSWKCHYDFRQRVVITDGGGIAPFSQMDREVLIAMRDRLVELGGHPPELGPEASPATKASAPKFNL